MNSQLTKLKPEWEMFCQLYASSEEFFGNGVMAYAKAYNVNLSKRGAYSVAGANASRLLKNVKILQRIDEILEVYMNDQFVDKQLAFLVTQNAELSTKLGAIKEYNALKKRTAAPLINNGILLILEKYGLSDVGQTSDTSPRLPEESPRP